MNCENCRFWQDHTDRVFVRMSVQPESKHGYGLIEAHKCRYTPHPMIQMVSQTMYTDKDFSCSEWKPKQCM